MITVCDCPAIQPIAGQSRISPFFNNKDHKELLKMCDFIAFYINKKDELCVFLIELKAKTFDEASVNAQLDAGLDLANFIC